MPLAHLWGPSRRPAAHPGGAVSARQAALLGTDRVGPVVERARRLRVSPRLRRPGRAARRLAAARRVAHHVPRRPPLRPRRLRPERSDRRRRAGPSLQRQVPPAPAGTGLRRADRGPVLPALGPDPRTHLPARPARRGSRLFLLQRVQTTLFRPRPGPLPAGDGRFPVLGDGRASERPPPAGAPGGGRRGGGRRRPHRRVRPRRLPPRRGTGVGVRTGPGAALCPAAAERRLLGRPRSGPPAGGRGAVGGIPAAPNRFRSTGYWPMLAAKFAC